jgi:GT2 family glycosyltransferase
MTESGVQLSVVIGTMNRLYQLQRAISSIHAQTRTSYRIYVTDAGSTDGTVEFLQKLNDERVVPVLEGRRLGQATAYNRVFRTLQTPYVCWLSDDNEIVGGSLDLAVEILRRERRIGMVGLKVRDVQGPFAEAPYIGGVSSLGILNVNQGVLRTEELLRVGAFSEWFQLYGIDPDLTAKVILSGLDVVYTRQVAILHYRNWPADTTTPEFAHVMEKQKESQAKYLRKYGAVLPGSRWHDQKKAFWGWLKKKKPTLASINSPEKVWGSQPRDWHNVMHSRFISVTELLVSGRKTYHLRQHAPRRVRPALIPPDPVEVPIVASSP